MAEVTGPGRREMAELAARLAGADKRLQRALRKELRQTAVPLAGECQRAIRKAPAVRPGLLREEIAATVGVSVSTSARRGPAVAIVSNGNKMPPGKGNLPAHADRGRWRHPVFGHEDRWVVQLWPGAAGWFHATIRDAAPRFRGAAERALTETAHGIEGH